MTKKEIGEMLKTGKVITWSGYWFDCALGYSIILMFPVFMLLFAKDDFKELPLIIQTITAISGGIAALMGYGYFNERKLIKINNEFTKEQNQNILKDALNNLNWKHQMKPTHFDFNIDDQKYLLKFVKITLIPEDNYIALNIMYYGGLKGRWPYFLGIKTFLTLKLKKEIIKYSNNALYK